MTALLTPDEELLRRFGRVRAVGLVAYLLGVGVTFALFGSRSWPLLIGVPVLSLATLGYFLRSSRAPRSSVLVSLLADAIVLGGFAALLGGTSRGAVLLYGIVIVSAGILLGPLAALSFAVLTSLLVLGQLAVEELGQTPAFLFVPQLDDRVAVVVLSIVLLASLGFLTATYAGRLHDLIAIGDRRAATVQQRGRRRHQLVHAAGHDVRRPLAELEHVADALDTLAAPADVTEEDTGSTADVAGLARRIRASTTLLEAEVGLLSDLGALDAVGEGRLEPVDLARVTGDVIAALGARLDAYPVERNVGEVRVAGDRRGARRVVYSLLENVVEHTPPGTTVRVTALTTAGKGVLAVTDSGPGVAPELEDDLFAIPSDPDRTAQGQTASTVGLPLVAELCQAMRAEVRYEPAPGGGARFLVAFRLAPRSAPLADERDGSSGPSASGGLDRLDAPPR